MTRSELIKKISRKAGIPDSDVKLFFEILLKRLSSSMKIGQAAYLKDFGYFFLLKGKINKSRMNFIDDDVPDTYIDFILFSLTKDLQSSIQEGLIFNVPTSDEDDFHPVDSYFNLSIGKPLIPLRGASTDEFYIPTGGFELRRLIESKVEKIISETEILSAYESNPPQIILTSQAFSNNRISLELNEPELKLDEEIPESFIETGELKKDDTLKIEHVAWDFGVEFSDEIEIRTESAQDNKTSEEMIESTDIITEENAELAVSETEIEKTLEEVLSDNINLEVSNPEDEIIISDELDVNLEDKTIDEKNDIEEVPLKLSDEIIGSDELRISLDEKINENEVLLDAEVAKEEEIQSDINISSNDSETELNQISELPEEEEFEEIQTELDNVAETEVESDKIPNDKFQVMNENLNNEYPPEEEPEEEYQPDKESFSEDKELKRVREELYSYQPQKSKVPLIIIIIGTIIIAAMLYFYITQIKNVGSTQTQSNLSLKTDKASIVERSFELPVYYPYPKKQDEELSKSGISENPVNETKATQTGSNQNNIEPLNSQTNNNDKNLQKQNQITVPPPSQNYERVAANIFRYGDHYVVQVAAFRSNSIAENEAAKLRNKGYKAFVEKAEIQGNGTWFRLRVGNFPTLRDAQEFQSRIKL